MGLKKWLELESHRVSTWFLGVSTGKKHAYVYSNRLSLGKIRREENILWSFAPHDIAVILRIIGKLPFQVIACGGTYVQPNLADLTITILLFDGGVRAHIHVSWLHPFKEQRLVVVGSEKMASFDDVTKMLRLFDQRVEVKAGEPIPIRNDGEEIAYSLDEPLRLECQAFLEAIRTGRPPLTDGYSGLNVLRVLQAAQRSLVLNGQQETLAPENMSENRVKVVKRQFTDLERQGGLKPVNGNARERAVRVVGGWEMIDQIGFFLKSLLIWY